MSGNLNVQHMKRLKRRAAYYVRKHKKCVAARDWKGANECSTLIRALDCAAAALRDVEDEFARVAGVKS